MAFVSLSLYLSRSETTCSQIGLVEKYPKPRLRKRRGKKIGLEELEEEIGLRKKKKKRQRKSATWARHAISDFCLFVFVSFFCFFLCQSPTFFLSLNPNPSSSLFWFMDLIFSCVWFTGLIHGFMGLILMGLIHGFMQSLDFWFMGSWVWFFWVHEFDYLLRKSIKEKKILIISIFWASFHLLFCRTWRTVLGSPTLFWVCICSGFALVLGLFLILGFISCFSGFDGD